MMILTKIIDTVLTGKVTKYTPNRKIFLEKDGYNAIISLDYFGKKQPWLLIAYKLEK